MDKKQEVLELLHKYGEESEMFKAFVTEDEFANLAADLLKLFKIPDVMHRELIINTMGWNHRILAHKDGDEMYFQVHEVYYDDKGKPESYTANGVSVGDDSLEGINLILDQMKECSKKPILSIEDFPNEYTGT